nr:DEAD-box ATP-dependent RNA helicase CshA [Chlamydiota bacterium]
MTSFNDFSLNPEILKALKELKYVEPSPVQAKAIPYIQARRDLIAIAETGSGKTATCAIPICNRVNTSSSKTQALIIVPTRELAMQYTSETQKIGKYRGVKSFAIVGGEDAGIQEAKLSHAVHVLVATPGRLIDFIYSRRIDLSQVEVLVLDEADEMLNMGFYEDLQFIIQCLVHEHQTLLFSATMPKQIRSLAKNHLKDPVEVSLMRKNISPENIEHRFLYCRADERPNALIDLIRQTKPKQSLIFCHTRSEVEKVCRALRNAIDAVDFLHGSLNQDARKIITRKFRNGRVKHLVATNVAARGLDFSSVSHVFIYHLSDDPDIYV